MKQRLGALLYILFIAEIAIVAIFADGVSLLASYSDYPAAVTELQTTLDKGMFLDHSFKTTTHREKSVNMTLNTQAVSLLGG